MDKLKRYIECFISTETCNLRCHYCYIAQKRKFNNKIMKLPHSPEYVRKALSKDRMGGTCLVNLCAGGETLIADDVIVLIKELLTEGHYVMVVTNGTLTKRFDEIAGLPREILKRLVFKFSFHYLELKRLNYIDIFFENIKKMQQAGCSFTLEVTPNDELIPYIEEIKQVSMDKLGALCHCTIARDDRTTNIDVLSSHTLEEVVDIWGVLDSELLNFKSTIFYKKRTEFCYAGDWSIYLNITTGDYRQCYCGKCLGNIYDDINKPLYFEAIGTKCTLPHCYNGHAFLTLGDIPELDTPNYADLRNRMDINGREWLIPEMKSFMSQKLCENNDEYSSLKKTEIIIKDKLVHLCNYPRRVARKIYKRIRN